MACHSLAPRGESCHSLAPRSHPCLGQDALWPGRVKGREGGDATGPGTRRACREFFAPSPFWPRTRRAADKGHGAVETMVFSLMWRSRRKSVRQRTGARTSGVWGRGRTTRHVSGFRLSGSWEFIHGNSLAGRWWSRLLFVCPQPLGPGGSRVHRLQRVYSFQPEGGSQH